MSNFPFGHRIFVTRRAERPRGAVVLLKSLDADGLHEIQSDLNLPDNIIFGPDGRLYYSETYVERDHNRFHRLWRSTTDGTEKQLICEWDVRELRLVGFLFSPKGDFYFGTISIAPGLMHNGVWKISNLASGEDHFAIPERILDTSNFQPPANKQDGAMIAPVALLQSGPYAGDMLLVQSTRAFGSEGTSKNIPVTILRATGPHFCEVEVFIREHRDEETDKLSAFFSLAINSDGHVFITDDENGKILKFSDEGKFLETFAEIDPIHMISIGENDTVFATNMEFPQDQPARGGLFVFEKNGSLVAEINSPHLFQGVAVVKI